MDTSSGEGAGALRPIPYMGVIYVVAEAMKLGFWNGHPEWCNLSPWAKWLRFSFGPDIDNVRLGLDRLCEMVAEAKAGGLSS